MWQFMPATGKTFELKQNAFRDDRRDVLASTRAALDYLQKLYGMFGDWHLALAAYNWGEGSVARAIAKNQRANLGTGYLDLTMPAETRMYVPKLQAVKNLVSSPQSFATTLPVIENHPYFQTVTLRRDIDVALAAKLAQVQLDDFRALNPSLSRPVILAAGTPQILLPWDNAAIFMANLLAQGDTAQLATWTAWQAPTSMKPAEAAKRVGMVEQELRSINKIPSGVMIKAGSTLLVARPASMRNDVAEQVADNAQLSLSPMPLLTRTSVRAGKDETVATVARRFKVPASSVAEWNRTSTSAAFKPGQTVTLYLTARLKSAVATSSPSNGRKLRNGKGIRPVQMARR
jgi:membrane-bound lytic murein transglycosylase D